MKYWITDDRFKWISLLLFLIFVIVMLFFYLKADEITKDPCSICSKYLGEKVVCTTGDFMPIQREYYPNNTIVNKMGWE